MSKPSNLEHFLESIMQINVIHLGGARAGIIGSSDVNNMTVNDLRKSAIAFAKEYQKQRPNHTKLTQNSKQVQGHLLSLQLTNTLSENKVRALIDELEKLTDEVSS